MFGINEMERPLKSAGIAPYCLFPCVIELGTKNRNADTKKRETARASL